MHRDIKPANLLVTEVDGGDCVKLADFGLARNYQTSMMSGLTLEGELLGTLAFMPPEQITNSRDVQPAGDQFSVAATLYNLFTGKFIYDPARDVRKQLVVMLEEDPVPIRTRRPDLPKDLAACIHKAPAREPADRYADVRDLRQALARFAR